MNINILEEMGAYEALWLQNDINFRNIAKKISSIPNASPSNFVQIDEAEKAKNNVMKHLNTAGIKHFGILLNQVMGYPKQLRDAEYPVELLYYQGELSFLKDHQTMAIIGSREATDVGIKRAKKLARELVGNGFTVTSGLAKGIDTAAHISAIENGGKTIAVIGTPLNSYYPKENIELQKLIAHKHLLISQVPVLKYSMQTPQQNRYFFPERNATMSALTLGTIIVEANENSGTLIQARAALKQGRKLFILNSCFEKKDITWPKKYLEQGAIRVKTMNDIWNEF